jgi:hypothetical protein
MQGAQSTLESFSSLLVERSGASAAILMYMFNSGVRNFELMCYVNAVQAMRAEGWNKE